MNLIQIIVTCFFFFGIIVAQIPYKNCGNPNDHIKIKSLNVVPNPPLSGQNITILASGSTDETITEETVNIDLFFEQVNLLNQTFDLCVILSGLGVTCPIAEGPLSFKISQNLPSGSI